MRVAIYVRESHLLSSTDQLSVLRQVADQTACTVVATFSDKGDQCLNPKEPMPALDALMKAAEQRVFAKVLVWDISTFGNSMEELVALVQRLRSCKVDVLFHKQGMDTGSTQGYHMTNFFDSLVHYQNTLTASKIRAGQRRAVGHGAKLGRPTNMTESVRVAIRLLHHKGLGKKKIAKELRVGVGSVIAAL